MNKSIFFNLAKKSLLRSTTTSSSRRWKSTVNERSWAIDALQAQSANANMEVIAKPIDEVLVTSEVLANPDENVEKLVQQVLALNMKETSLFVQVLQAKLGFTNEDAFGSYTPGQSNDNSNNDGGSSGSEAAAEVVEQTAFDIILKAFDPKSKIKVIKEVRAITGLGLKEAKELVESAPIAITKGISKEEADNLAAKLAEINAEIEIK